MHATSSFDVSLPSRKHPMSDANPKTVIVVPAYNEAKRLNVEAFREFLGVRAHANVGFVFVNDGSLDNTEELLRGLCRSSEPGRVRAISMQTNVGKAEAVRVGMLESMNGGEAYIGYWDADLAAPLDEIAHIARSFKRNPTCAIAMGSRVKLLGRNIQRKAARHYLSRFFATAVSIALSLPVYDTQCGAKLFPVSDETRALFAQPFLTRWIFDVELLARFVRLRLDAGQSMDDLAESIQEIPLYSCRDVAGSKIKASDIIAAVLQLGAIYFRYLRRRAGAVYDIVRVDTAWSWLE